MAVRSASSFPPTSRRPTWNGTGFSVSSLQTRSAYVLARSCWRFFLSSEMVLSCSCILRMSFWKEVRAAAGRIKGTSCASSCWMSFATVSISSGSSFSAAAGSLAALNFSSTAWSWTRNLSALPRTFLAWLPVTATTRRTPAPRPICSVITKCWITLEWGT
eukprot:Mycagemm_TRINITY_DN10190_c0_g2::TRINITY_DN10190_c0_g2_i2::g.5043::m.5043 type:complete len:161 gc:universal TRINITY_DN10190_c0_g2_i2:913-431(-)